MSPEEREAFRAWRRAARDARPDVQRRPEQAPVVPMFEQGATTIDALFGELPSVETAGQVWVLEDDRLRVVPVQVGVTDGTASELLAPLNGTELMPGATLVTAISTPDNGNSQAGGSSPLIVQFGRQRR